MCPSRIAEDATSALRPNHECTVECLSIVAESMTAQNTTYLPKVNNDLVCLCVAAVICVLFPVIDVNVRDSTNKQFQFSFIKDIDQIWWNEFIKPSHEGVKLLFDPFLNSPFRDETNRSA
jgi:hypothetical protein